MDYPRITSKCSSHESNLRGTKRKEGWDRLQFMRNESPEGESEFNESQDGVSTPMDRQNLAGKNLTGS